MATAIQNLPVNIDRHHHGTDASMVAIIPAMELQQLSDEQLLERFRVGAGAQEQTGKEAANELFRRYHSKIARWCYQFTNDRESAADLGQEICARAYVNLGSFQGDSKFSTWLYSVARNHCLNAIRSRATEPIIESDDEILSVITDAAEDPEVNLLRRSAADLARTLINEALDETEKVIFTLHYAEEVPLDTITRMLSLENASGAKAFIVSARRKLGKAVERWKARNKTTRVDRG